MSLTRFNVLTGMLYMNSFKYYHTLHNITYVTPLATSLKTILLYANYSTLYGSVNVYSLRHLHLKALNAAHIAYK